MVSPKFSIIDIAVFFSYKQQLDQLNQCSQNLFEFEYQAFGGP